MQETLLPVAAISILLLLIYSFDFRDGYHFPCRFIDDREPGQAPYFRYSDEASTFVVNGQKEACLEDIVTFVNRRRVGPDGELGSLDDTLTLEQQVSMVAAMFEANYHGHYWASRPWAYTYDTGTPLLTKLLYADTDEVLVISGSRTGYNGAFYSNTFSQSILLLEGGLRLQRRAPHRGVLLAPLLRKLKENTVRLEPVGTEGELWLNGIQIKPRKRILFSTDVAGDGAFFVRLFSGPALSIALWSFIWPCIKEGDWKSGWLFTVAFVESLYRNGILPLVLLFLGKNHWLRSRVNYSDRGSAETQFKEEVFAEESETGEEDALPQLLRQKEQLATEAAQKSSGSRRTGGKSGEDVPEEEDSSSSNKGRKLGYNRSLSKETVNGFFYASILADNTEGDEERDEASYSQIPNADPLSAAPGEGFAAQDEMPEESSDSPREPVKATQESEEGAPAPAAERRDGETTNSAAKAPPLSPPASPLPAPQARELEAVYAGVEPSSRQAEEGDAAEAAARGGEDAEAGGQKRAASGEKNKQAQQQQHKPAAHIVVQTPQSTGVPAVRGGGEEAATLEEEKRAASAATTEAHKQGREQDLFETAEEELQGGRLAGAHETRQKGDSVGEAKRCQKKERPSSAAEAAAGQQGGVRCNETQVSWEADLRREETHTNGGADQATAEKEAKKSAKEEEMRTEWWGDEKPETGEKKTWTGEHQQQGKPSGLRRDEQDGSKEEMGKQTTTLETGEEEEEEDQETMFFPEEL